MAMAPWRASQQKDFALESKAWRSGVERDSLRRGEIRYCSLG